MLRCYPIFGISSPLDTREKFSIEVITLNVVQYLFMQQIVNSGRSFTFNKLSCQIQFKRILPSKWSCALPSQRIKASIILIWCRNLPSSAGEIVKRLLFDSELFSNQKRLNAYWLRQLVSLVDGLWRKSFDVNSFLSLRLLPFNALMIWNEPTKWEYIFILLYYWATNGFWGWNWDLEFIMG